MAVVDDQKLRLSTDGTAYLIYNSTTGKIEIYVNSVKQGEWG